ncbi:Amidohydrolase [Rhodovulum sp. ES.010]|uniref:amidohydrolase family protein n=1 Tax=Rhodovulum sp. ES.010 TaxID=1882821 RepID=UPI000928EE38|nr:amidohydrolase family protein [Rhodovulum sp. ES.010]SIO55425.1 Amidohydrolase [Rhodovulum sp. ES.010]
MAGIEITNCHIHTFTTAHAPRYYPVGVVALFRAMPVLLTALRRAARLQPWQGLYDSVVRLENFHRTGRRLTQRDVFLEVLRYYPRSTRFVVLPMDMAQSGHGPVDADIHAQHRELFELTQDPDYGHRVIPFATIFPGRGGAVDELRRCIDDYGFRGVKLYTKLGYAPTDDVLMREVYPLCTERGLPVMTHCSRGGVRHKRWSQARADRVTDPRAYIPVMEAFPGLKLCLAHFGGDQDWKAYLTDGFDPEDPEARTTNWLSLIVDMIRSGDYPNLYTDISYTIFKFAAYLPLLRLFMEDPVLRTRILFGSDFYMTRQEKLSEKAVSIGLRDALGEAHFRQIAETNPRGWLGEA